MLHEKLQKRERERERNQGSSLIKILYWLQYCKKGLLPCIQCRWSIPLCIIQISYANSVINNAETGRFIIPRYQRRLNTVDLHANSPNHAVAFASRLTRWTISSRPCSAISLHLYEANGIRCYFRGIFRTLLTRSLVEEKTQITRRGKV